MAEFLIAVRTDDAKDYVVDSSTLTTAPSVAKDFPIGTRVYVTDVAKCFPKADTMAETLLLGKWVNDAKPTVGTIGTVLGSTAHPSEEGCIVAGIRTEVDSKDYVIDIKGLAKPTNVSKEYADGTAIRVVNADKVFPKMDSAAKELALSKWVSGAKPQNGEVGTVVGSTVHPADPKSQVIAIRTAKGQDFVIAPVGLEKVTSESKAFPVGARVYIRNPDKLFPKMDEVAKKIGLCRWAPGAKPAIPVTPAAPAKPAADATEKAAEGAEAPAEEPEAAADDDSPAAKKRKLGKPLMSCAGEVRGSAPHPSGSGIVVGVRAETGQEFLVAEEGLELVPTACSEFPFGTRVKIGDAGKVYPKNDDKAFELSLTRWTNGEKPTKVMTGKVIGSVTK